MFARTGLHEPIYRPAISIGSDRRLVDNLPYAGNLDNVASVVSNQRHRFAQADICNMRDMRRQHHGRQ
jgi:dTDP-D-glucose 4,6-dehydratase